MEPGKEFKNKILFIGYGAVARCTLPMLLRHISIPLEHITILDFIDKTEELKPYISKGLKFHITQINQDNLTSVLAQHLQPGDICVDLAYEIDTLSLLKWCHDNQVCYLNASVEEWHPYGKSDTYAQTLYYRHMRIREVTDHWVNDKTKQKTGATAVLDHGANPGLISHFVRQAIVDIGTKGVSEGKFSSDKAERVQSLLTKVKENKDRKDSFANLAMELDIKVIHCSERDTQVTNKPRELGEFVNTWSVEGFYEEGIAPAEMGWGTHEQWLPSRASYPPEGPKNEIFFKQAGMNTWVRSFVPPNHNIIGMVIRHGEAFSISEHLTVWDEKEKVARYRPTVHYAYMPCDGAIASLQELRGQGTLQSKIRIYRDDEIQSGADILGALVMGHVYNSWWTGSELNIETAKKLVPNQNSTVIQVGAGMLGAILWVIENPNEGVCVPDDLPHDFILKFAKPYLGNFISDPFDWTPLKNRKDLFPRADSVPETDDPWQ